MDTIAMFWDVFGNTVTPAEYVAAWGSDRCKLADHLAETWHQIYDGDPIQADTPCRVDFLTWAGQIVERAGENA